MADVPTPVASRTNPLTVGVVRELARIVGPHNVLNERNEVLVYECDGYTLQREVPDAVVLPGSTEEVAQIVSLLHKEGIPFVPRGAGTSLSGATVPLGGGVIISLARMKRILDVDLRNRRAVVEAGIVNAWVSRAVEDKGYHFAPDPSSQTACTIGGNVATNSGGPHTLKYGVTVNHILGLKVVLPDGEIVEFGGSCLEGPSYDLTGLFVGSEGTLGLATEMTLNLVPLPQSYRTLLAVYETVEEACQTVSDVIEKGIVPAAMEIMDQLIIQAVEEAFHFGFPLDAGAVLIIELDGLEAGLDAQVEAVKAICTANRAVDIREASDPRSRAHLWAARKKAFGAAGRLANSYVTQDGVVPRVQLPEILRRVYAAGEKYNLRVANVFHAGDGNIHPLILYNPLDPDEVHRVVKCSDEILRACIELGGTVTGEHGIGIEKIGHMSLVFNDVDLEVMTEVRTVFNPHNLANPGKLLPTPGSCVEITRPRPAAPA